MMNNKKDCIRIVLIGLIISFLAFIPMITEKGISVRGDGTYHLARIESMADAMREGIFPVKLHFSSEFGFGYGSGFFYPNFLLYFPAFLMLFGVTLNSAYKIFLLVVLNIMFFSTYLSLNLVVRKREVSVIAAALMILSTPVFFSVYSMFSLGNYTAMIFMPPAICGMWGVMQCEKNKFLNLKYSISFGVGFLGLILTHTLSLLFSFIVCLLIMFFYIKNIFTFKEIFFRIFFIVLTVLALSAAYWIPMLEQFSVQKYKVSLPYIDPSKNYSDLFEIIMEERYGIFLTIFTISVCIVVFKMKFKKKYNENKKLILFASILSSLCILILLFTCWKWFWEKFGSVFLFIQVPARLWNISFVCIIIAFCIVFSLIEINYKKKFMMGMILILMSYLFSLYYLPDDLNDKRVLYTDTKITDIDHGDGSGGLEWLPLKNGRNFNEPNKAVANDGSGADGIKEKTNTEYKVWLLTEKEWYDIPYVYYKGYHAYLENGVELASDVNHKTGLFRVYMPKDSEDEIITVVVKYIPTVLQKISYIISIGYAVFLVVFIIREIRKCKQGE